MSKFLNDIRGMENKLPVNRKNINTIVILCFGTALGTFSKFLDMIPINRLRFVFSYLDIVNFLRRFAIWVFIALCISVYSNSSVRAGINVSAFFVGMVTSYYLYFSKNYAIIWFGFTAISLFLAFISWYEKGVSNIAFALSAVILAVLFNMTFVYEWGYFETRSILEFASLPYWIYRFETEHAGGYSVDGSICDIS